MLGNEELKPERNKEIELGFDLGLLNERVDLGFTWYDRNSEDVILQLPINQSQFGAGRQLAAQHGLPEPASRFGRLVVESDGWYRPAPRALAGHTERPVVDPKRT